MRILCLGNADNLGIRVYNWLRKSGVSTDLCRVTADEDSKRGSINFYQKEDSTNIFIYKKNLHTVRLEALWGSAFIDSLNKKYDCVLITGGFHALLLSSMLKVPKIFIPVGYEVSYHAASFRNFPNIIKELTNLKSSLGNFFYSTLARRALSRCSAIADSYPLNVEICKKLGLGSKIKFLGLGLFLKYL